MSKTYIHYGDDKFDKEKFNFDMNNRLCNKPMGGIWASPVDTLHGWKDWCESEDFNVYRLGLHFTFKLKDEARVLTISSMADMDKLDKFKEHDIGASYARYDFNLIKQDYDAVELELSKDHRLYDAMWGWDCDSIVVLNPDVIEEVS